MTPLALHEYHEALGASFREIGGMEVVAHYRDAEAEYHALTRSAAVMDLSCRSRLVLLGPDRQKMLNGQVTNNVKDLTPGQGCYAALVNAKGRMVADTNIYVLPDELLLDLEPGLGPATAERLEKFIVADDVQVIDAAPHYGLLSIQGPRAIDVLERLDLFPSIPDVPLASTSASHPDLGALYLMHQARTGTRGYDVFAPTAAMIETAGRLTAAAKELGGRPCGWDALEVGRIEAGIPRYGIDMDESNLPPEAGIDERAVSYTKGCYSGQEVLARIRTYGQVAKALRGLKLPEAVTELPARRTPLFNHGREVGYITSATHSPQLGHAIALGYVRRECNGPGMELVIGSSDSLQKAIIVPLPFVGLLLA